jgi:hypothetical protein
MRTLAVDPLVKWGLIQSVPVCACTSVPGLRVPVYQGCPILFLKTINTTFASQNVQ